MLNIYIYKKASSLTSISYILNKDFFSYDLEFDFTDVLDDELFRLSLLSNPFNEFNSITIYGVRASNELIQSFETIFNTSISCEISISSLPSSENLTSIDEENSNIILGFSGGFDSLAAKALLPTAQLVSIDFGGNFAREANFFKKFKTNICKWDLRSHRLNFLNRYNESLNWRFMLAPACLLRKHQKHAVIATGTILEASPFWMNPKPREQIKTLPNFAFGKGIALINPVSGLTEYSTAKIVLESNTPHIVDESLSSLASPNYFKYFRKICLLAAIKNDKNLVLNRPNTMHKLGSSFADDFLTLYLCWKFGIDWVKEFYCSNIPSNITIHNMEFIEKVNSNNMLLISNPFNGILLDRINHYGIPEYNSIDYSNLRAVFEQLTTKNFTN